MSSKSVQLLLAIATAPFAVAQQTQIEPLLAKIANYNYGESREPLARFTKVVEDSLGSPAILGEIEAALLKLVLSGATPAATDFALRQLSLVATDKSVPVLSGMLIKPETAEMALYALTRVPGSAADDALLKTLPRVSGDMKIGIVNSLGQRRARKAVATLRPMLVSADAGLAEVVALALSDIADQAALDSLASARRKATGSIRYRITDAYLRCAHRITNKIAALKVYRELIEPREPEHIRIAALGGLTSNDSSAALPVLTAHLNSESTAVQAAAVRLLSETPDPEITAVLIQHFPRLSPTNRATALAALADRGDATAAPLFVASLKNPGLRSSALSGLGKLGDASTVNVLAEAAATSEGAERESARASLYTLRGPGTDEAVISGLASATGKTKIELIMAAGERGIIAAAGLLIEAVEEKDPDVHREALRGLRNVAGPAEIPALLQILVRAATASDRRETAQTVASALRRSDPGSVDAVISTYRTTTAMPARLALLDVMGQTSSELALPVLHEALNDSSAELARGAILALSEWGSPAPMDDLLSIAQGASNPTLQVLALRGYLKLMVLPSQRSAAENARKLAQAMQLAKQPAEKRTILSLLSTFPSKESLAAAEAATQDQTVVTEAKAAVERINSLLKFQ